MKKKINFFVALNMTTCIIPLITACHDNEHKLHDLEQVVKSKNLGIISTSLNDGKLKPELLLQQYFEKINPEIDSSKIIFKNITYESAEVWAKEKPYIGKTKLFFNHHNVDLKNLITPGTSINLIQQDNGSLIDSTTIIAALKARYINLAFIDFTKIMITVANNYVTLTGKGSPYYDSVNIVYTLKKSVPLPTVVKDKNLGVIKTKGNSLPTATMIIECLASINKKLNKNAVAVTDITANSAKIIVHDRSIYHGYPIMIEYIIDKMTALATILKTTHLGNVIFTDNLTSADKNSIMLQKLQYFNPDLVISAVKLVNITFDHDKHGSFKVAIVNNDIYFGDEVKIIFTYNNTINLNKIISKSSISEVIKIPTTQTSLPDEAQIKTALSNEYKILNCEKIKISNIKLIALNNGQVTIESSDFSFYWGGILIINFTFKNIDDVNAIITNSDLGKINIYGLPPLTKEEKLHKIRKYLKINYPILENDKIRIENLDETTGTVEVVGDNIRYWNRKIITFKFDDQPLKITNFNYSNTIIITDSDDTKEFPQVTIINWKNYAESYDRFSNRFKTLSFGGESKFTLYDTNKNYINKANVYPLIVNLNQIPMTKTFFPFKLDDVKPISLLKWRYWTYNVKTAIGFWRDENNIYLIGSLKVSSTGWRQTANATINLTKLKLGS